jgi:CRISPR-associated protein Csb2
MPCLLISVRFHDGRYHGRPAWPPSRARLFQALVAGAAQGETLAEKDKDALKWLESLEDAPVIATPPMRPGQPFKNFVPNNDLDAVGGDPRRVGEIRAPKLIRPILFDAETPLLYVWTFDEASEARANAQRIRAIAERLYQFGRGVDMAWAWGEILDASEAEARLAAHGGALARTTLAKITVGKRNAYTIRRLTHEISGGRHESDAPLASVRPAAPRSR